MTNTDWRRVMRGWWWLPQTPGDPNWHADVNVTIWPVWRFNVTRWDSGTPTHNVARGFRFGCRRAMRAAERALAALAQKSEDVTV